MQCILVYICRPVRSWIAFIVCELTRQQIGGELNPAKAQSHRLGNRLDEFRLPETGQAFQKQMPSREHTYEDTIDQQFLTKEHILKRALEAAKFGSDRLNINLRGEALAHDGVCCEKLFVELPQTLTFFRPETLLDPDRIRPGAFLGRLPPCAAR